MGARKYLIPLLLFIAGCVSSSGDDTQIVFDHYQTIVFEDGITLEESKIIAQKQLIKKNVVELYNLSKPQVADDVSELPDYEKYWFIFFEEKRPASIPFIFMVLVDRKNGKVKFADDFNEGNRWILEAALLH